jgi:hypothetical protein
MRWALASQSAPEVHCLGQACGMLHQSCRGVRLRVMWACVNQMSYQSWWAFLNVKKIKKEVTEQ